MRAWVNHRDCTADNTFHAVLDMRVVKAKPRNYKHIADFGISLPTSFMPITMRHTASIFCHMLFDFLMMINILRLMPAAACREMLRCCVADSATRPMVIGHYPATQHLLSTK